MSTTGLKAKGSGLRELRKAVWLALSLQPLALSPVLAAVPSIDFDGLTGKKFTFEIPKPLPRPLGGVARSAGVGDTVVVASPGVVVISEQTLFDTLSRADLVFVGEQHDQASHHLLQSLLLKRLKSARPDVQVGFEMLDVTQQSALDDYLSGHMSESDFAAFWKKAWGYPFEIYRPVLDFARTSGIKGRALNAPLSVVRQVVKGGLASLTSEQRKLLPAVIRPITDPRYLAYVRRSLSEHGPMPPAQEARMLEAMAVWNETMGQSLTDALASGPVVVVAGMGHMLYDAGILESVKSRSAALQKVVLPYPMDGTKKPAEELLRALKDPASDDIQLADYFWLNP